jgi:hypothetical protein
MPNPTFDKLTHDDLRLRLTALVNIPRPGATAATFAKDPKTASRAVQFVERYGALRKGLGDPASTLAVAAAFQIAWRDKSDADKIERFLESVFAPIPGSPLYARLPSRPAFAASLSRGDVAFKPRDLLDALAMEFLRSRKALHRCERSDCGRFFIKTHSRDRYCSKICSEEVMRKNQAEWARKKRKGE